MAVRLIDLQLLYGIAGAREQFENLCAQLIRSQSPTAIGIRVHRGDGGIDVYEGKFTGSEGIHVFQVKFFPNGLGKSQRNEIKESFTRCRTNTQFAARKWTLCLPVDLSIEETEWFSKWSQEEAKYGIDIDRLGATQLENLLYHADNRGIKEAFFKEEYLTQIREMHSMLQSLVDDIFTRLGEPSKKLVELRRNFRDERLNKIVAGETLAPLDKNAPKIVLHVIPFGAFDPAAEFNVALLTHGENVHLTEPLKLYLGGYRYPQPNFDGLLNYEQDTYMQVFRNGSIEAVDTTILGASREKRITSGNIYEKRLLEALKRYIAAQKQLGVDLPLFVMMSLLGVKGFNIGFNGFDMWIFQAHQIDRPELIVPEVKIDDFDCDLTGVMRPTFDIIANAAGWGRSMTYAEDGKSLL